MRSPPSRTRSITNWPGLAASAMSGAFSTNSLVTGVRRRAARMRVMAIASQFRMRVHRLEPPPAAVDFVLDAAHHVGMRAFGEMARLAHQRQPFSHRLAAAVRVGVVGQRGVAVLNVVEREEAGVDR